MGGLEDGSESGKIPEIWKQINSVFTCAVTVGWQVWCSVTPEGWNS